MQPWAGASPTQTLNFVRVGGTVTLSISGYTAQVTGGSGIGMSSSGYFLPTYLRPARNTNFATYVYNNNTYVIGNVVVLATGDINFYVGFSGNFTVSGSTSGGGCSCF